MALVVVPVAVAEDGGLYVLVPVVFFNADSDSEAVGVESRVFAHRGSLWWLCAWWVAVLMMMLHFVDMKK